MSLEEQEILLALQGNRETEDITKIPREPDEFYKDFGLIYHPEKGYPVPHLTAYQKRVWNEGQHYRYLLVVKSHRIGLSTSELLHDFWHAITDCRGKEILIVSQDLKHAKDHLYTLRKWILSSEKYRHYLVTKATELLMRDEITKVMEMYIKNPDDQFHPTRIIGLGGTAGGLWSWKDVKHIHMSDIAACPTEYSETINSALSRLALSGGHIVIETPPFGIGNPIHDLYLKAIAAETNPNLIGQTAEGFRLLQIDATAAVDAGVMTQKWLDDQRAILGSEFDAYYGAKFTALGGNIFNLDALERCFDLGRQLAQTIDYDNIDLRTGKSMGIDVGFGSSNTAFTIVEERRDRIACVIHTSSFDRPSYETMKDHALYLMQRYNVKKVFVDASAPAFIRSLKVAVGEEIEGETKDYDEAINEYKKNGVDYMFMMNVIPVNFSTMHKVMLANLKALVERPRTFAIDPDEFGVLCNEMLTAQEKEGKLNKEGRMTFDLFDSLRLAMLAFYVKPRHDPRAHYFNA